MASVISLSVVSFWKSELVKSGALSSRPLSVSAFPSSPWHLRHFALAKIIFPSGWGATGAGETGCGDCARTTASAIAITSSPSRVRAKRPFGRAPYGRADVGRSHRFGLSREGEDQRHDVRLPRALDGGFRSSPLQAAGLFAMARQRPRLDGRREAHRHGPLGTGGEEERVPFEKPGIERAHVGEAPARLASVPDAVGAEGPRGVLAGVVRVDVPAPRVIEDRSRADDALARLTPSVLVVVESDLATGLGGSPHGGEKLLGASGHGCGGDDATCEGRVELAGTGREPGGEFLHSEPHGGAGGGGGLAAPWGRGGGLRRRHGRGRVWEGGA